MIFTVILILCLAAGLGFAGIAAWLTTKKGNTISDVLTSGALKDAEAIKIEILDKIKLRSNVPIVGLYIVAAAVAIGLPAYIQHLNNSGDVVINLQGQLIKKPTVRVDLVPTNMHVEDSGLFKIPLPYRSGSQMINIQSQAYNPLTLTVKLNKAENKVTVGFSNETLQPEEIKVDSDTRIVEIKQKMPLFESPIAPGSPVANQPSVIPAAAMRHLSEVATETSGTVAMLPLTGEKL